MTQQQVANVFDGSDVINTVSRSGSGDLAVEFLNAIDQKELARFLRFFERLRDGHHVRSPENMRHIKGVEDPNGDGAEVHELKVHSGGGRRLYLVKYNSKWYATHGLLSKPADKKVPKEARRALEIFHDMQDEEEEENVVDLPEE